MKKFLLITASFFVLVTLCNAQTNVYHPFPDSNAVWGMSSGCSGVNCGEQIYIKNYYGGDTLIDGNNYKKIVEEVKLMTSGTCCGWPTSPGPGFLREDTIAKKVYWRAQWMSQDTLLYDFTLQVGDTLNDFLQCLSAQPSLTVVSIDSILIGGSYRKRINIDTNNINDINYSIIEGIGSKDGLAVPHCNEMTYGTILNCFSENGIVIYSPGFNPDTIPCGTLPVAVNDLHRQKKEMLTVFPNPTAGKITLTCQPTSLPLKIFIYDMFGRNHLEKEINIERSEIDISFLSTGIYLLRAENNIALLTFEKIIKQ